MASPRGTAATLNKQPKGKNSWIQGQGADGTYMKKAYSMLAC